MQTWRIDDARAPKSLAQSMTTGFAALVVFLTVSLGCPAGFAASLFRPGFQAVERICQSHPTRLGSLEQDGNAFLANWLSIRAMRLISGRRRGSKYR
jgi:hypothetical protein